MHLATLLELPGEEKQARGLLFTPQEIAQQPDTWLTTFQIVQQQQERLSRFLETAGVRDALERRPVVLLIGAGTSDYVGQALEHLLRMKWGCETRAVASTDLVSNLHSYVVPGRNYLWISFSRSGDSPEGVAVLEQATVLYPEIAQLVITCNAAARMAAVSRDAAKACTIVLDDKVNDRSLAMTSSFTNMVVAGQCLANLWSLNEYGEVLGRLVSAGRTLLPQAAEQAESIAAEQYPRACFLGSGALASVARESALKLLEMTAGQVKTMSETVLGLRHGPMAALDAGTLLLCFVSGEKAGTQYARDLLSEIGAKGVVGKRIAIGPLSAAEELRPNCELYLGLEGDIEDVYRPVLDVIVGQLLGLYSSVAHHLKPDSPSPGGVINRVVAKFRIY